MALGLPLLPVLRGPWHVVGYLTNTPSPVMSEVKADAGISPGGKSLSFPRLWQTITELGKGARCSGACLMPV